MQLGFAGFYFSNVRVLEGADRHTRGKEMWRTSFLAVLREVWKERRNGRYFEGEAANMDSILKKKKKAANMDSLIESLNLPLLLG